MIFVVFTSAYLDKGIRFAVRRGDVKGILDAPEGTAITMKDGSVFIVKESFEEALEKCNPSHSLFNGFCSAPADKDVEEHE